MLEGRAGVGRLNHLPVTCHGFGQGLVGLFPEFANTRLPFAGFTGHGALDEIHPCASMGVEHHEGLVFLGEVIQHLNPDEVLEHISGVAGVKGVAITEHKSRFVSG